MDTENGPTSLRAFKSRVLSLSSLKLPGFNAKSGDELRLILTCSSARGCPVLLRLWYQELRVPI